MCRTNLTRMNDTTSLSRMLTRGDWDRAKAETTVTIELDSRMLASSIQAALKPDAEIAHGRALRENINTSGGVQLRKGDRIETNSAVTHNQVDVTKLTLGTT